jgi:hypothetical protein
VQGLKPTGYQVPFSYGSGGVNAHRGLAVFLASAATAAAASAAAAAAAAAFAAAALSCAALRFAAFSAASTAAASGVGVGGGGGGGSGGGSGRGVAVQVEFESKLWNRVFHFMGSRVETRRFQAMGQLDSTCTAPPWEWDLEWRLE